jgi:hypothetical protein
MLQTLKNHLKVLIFGGVLLISTGLPVAAVQAQNIDGSVKCGAEIDFSQTEGCTQPSGEANPSNSLNHIIRTVINFLSVGVGIVAVIMIIIGGFKYVTSGGDSNSVASAKNTIIYALVGLVIAALAQVIVRFVLNAIR